MLFISEVDADYGSANGLFVSFHQATIFENRWHGLNYLLILSRSRANRSTSFRRLSRPMLAHPVLGVRLEFVTDSTIFKLFWPGFMLGFAPSAQ